MTVDRYIRLTGYLLCGLLAGCAAVGPDYVAPPLPDGLSDLPSSRFEASASPALSTDALPQYWWRLYNDPRLDGLVQEALSANTAVRVADANLERRQGTLRETPAAKNGRGSWRRRVGQLGGMSGV